MKFVGKNQQSQFSLRFQDTETNTFPFIDILQQKDLTDIKFIDKEEISFNDIFQLKVNVKKVGSVLFFFKKESFNKDGFVEEVTPLGEIESNTIADVIYKVSKLYEIANRFNPLFSIYCPEGDYILYQECYESLTGGVFTYYLSDYNPSKLQPKSNKLFARSNDKPKQKEQQKPQQKPEKIQKVEKKPSEKPEKQKLQFRNPLLVLKEDKYHYVFALVAAFLIGFTIAVSIFDMYLGKKIYYFFLVCSLVGAVLHCLIYKDTFIAHPVKSMETICNVFVSLVGYGLSIGGYFIFKSIAKDKPLENPKLGYILFIPIAVYLLSSVIGYLVSVILKKKRA